MLRPLTDSMSIVSQPVCCFGWSLDINLNIGVYILIGNLADASLNASWLVCNADLRLLIALSVLSLARCVTSNFVCAASELSLLVGSFPFCIGTGREDSNDIKLIDLIKPLGKSFVGLECSGVAFVRDAFQFSHIV